MTLRTRLAAGLGLLSPRLETPAIDPVTNTAPVLPARRPGGADEVAMSLDAVYRAVSIIQTAVLQLPIDALNADGSRRQDRVADLVATPERGKSLSAWLAETTASLALRGNAYWLTTRDTANVAVNLEVLDPLQVGRSRHPKTGAIVHNYQGKTFHGNEIIHLGIMRRPGQLEGLGPIQACAGRILGAADVAKYADNWIDAGNVPNGILTSPEPLTGEQASRYRDAFVKKVKSGEPVVLGSGLTYQPLFLTPSELQWLDTQNHNTASVARMFGIPARAMLAVIEGATATYSNVSQEDVQFVKFTLMAYLREIEDALSSVLPRGTRARFDLDGVLRTDAMSRYRAYQVGIEAGVLTTEEAKTKENRQ